MSNLFAASAGFFCAFSGYLMVERIHIGGIHVALLGIYFVLAAIYAKL